MKNDDTAIMDGPQMGRRTIGAQTGTLVYFDHKLPNFDHTQRFFLFFFFF
jgi:hypothetical protein